MNSNVALSIVVPIYNEEESLPFLVNQLLEALKPMEETFELVLVNDGSSDNSAEVIKKLSFEIPELVGVLLRKNYGQTAASCLRYLHPLTRSYPSRILLTNKGISAGSFCKSPSSVTTI